MFRSEKCPLVSAVLKKKLCTGCGTCIGMCPADALSWQKEKILADNEKCTSCGLCLKVCPGKGFNYPFFYEKVFQKKKVSFDFGHLEAVYKGYSLDKNIYAQSASGGLVTTLLLFLLREKEIDGAVVIGMDGIKPVVKMATTEEEILQGMQSKYIVFPTNQILKEISSFKGKIAYVGLPCQVQGLRLAMEHNPNLKKKISFVFALFCGFNMKKEATDYLLKNAKMKGLQKIEYRAKREDQTGFQATDEKGKRIFFEKHGHAFLNPLCCPSRCLLCSDLTGEFSDASFGDAWEISGTRVLVRQKRVEKLFLRMREKGLILLEESSVNDVLNTQKQLIDYKKKMLGARLASARFCPDYGMDISKGKGVFFSSVLRFLRFYPVRKMILAFPLRFYEKISRKLRCALCENGVFFRYLFWGVLTALFSFGSYAFLSLWMDYRIANVFSIIATKTLAYLTNKFFVFQSLTKGVWNTLKELGRFILSRAFSGIVDFLGLIFLVQVLHIHDYWSKTIMIVFVTILNYVLSKKAVFLSEHTGFKGKK